MPRFVRHGTDTEIVVVLVIPPLTAVIVTSPLSGTRGPIVNVACVVAVRAGTLPSVARTVTVEVPIALGTPVK